METNHNNHGLSPMGGCDVLGLKMPWMKTDPPNSKPDRLSNVKTKPRSEITMAFQRPYTWS